MVIVMEMDTGRYIEGEFGAFEEEVLNAQWLPQPLAAQVGLQHVESCHGSSTAKSVDTDAFLRTVYLNQE